MGLHKFEHSQNGILKNKVTAQHQLLYNVHIPTEGSLKTGYENVKSDALRMMDFERLLCSSFHSSVSSGISKQA